MTAVRQVRHRDNPLLQLSEAGQAIWLDFLSRSLIGNGDLERLVENDGLAGMTSNPSIFEKAIGQGTDYDSSLQAAEAEGDRDANALYERLAIEDIQHAAAVLRPLYDRTDGRDGFVSLEVSPYLAVDTKATIAEARRLWHAVGRPNLMIKVPATKAGLPAIRELTGEAININITLLFSQQAYAEVVAAYLSGLEHAASEGKDLSGIASVASFFVSRIDAAVDKRIEKILAAAPAVQREELAPLRGKIAIANAKLAYQIYKRQFAGSRWQALQAKGARVQRLLWASTGVKNPNYRDVLYVEELIAADTINTMPPATLDAFRDHGKVAPTLETGLDQAKQQLAALARSGISLEQVTSDLVDDGVKLFAEAFDKLLGAIARKRNSILGSRLNGQSVSLPRDFDGAVAAELEAWRHAGKVRRLWRGDASLWTGNDESRWLGWLDIVGEQLERIEALRALAADIRGPRFSHVVLLGMGGSSLGPEVLAQTFGPQAGRPELLVLDSTDPAQIRSIEARLDLARTLFVVSSKSGTTLEPNILKAYFLERLTSALGPEQAGLRFLAVTDPHSKLEEVATREHFRGVAFGKPSIGGRYSVLSDFGMVPAALLGLDLEKLLASARVMVFSCAASVPPAENPGVRLGVILGQSAKLGRDKITIVASPPIADFGAWLEQLVAESTGKQGKGLIPVDAEPLGRGEVYGPDRLFVYIRLATDPDAAQDDDIAGLERAGQPVLRLDVADRYQLGQEFFRWELATAVAGALIGINPFDQPDVEASKVKTRELTAAFEVSGELPAETPLLADRGIELFADPANAQALAGSGDTLATWLRAHLDRLGAGDYCAFLAYIERNDVHRELLQEMRLIVRDRKRVATCLGFGPRFLHSTGQVYKGGPNSGVFLQITADEARDLRVPDEKVSFGIAKAAAARGDFAVLAERRRRALRLHLKSNIAAGLATLKGAIEEALAQRPAR
jgi:transaldolase / glucose-6-phosphate isomerase